MQIKRSKTITFDVQRHKITFSFPPYNEWRILESNICRGVFKTSKEAIQAINRGEFDYLLNQD